MNDSHRSRRERPLPDQCQHPRCSRWITKDQTRCARHREGTNDPNDELPPSTLDPPPSSDTYRVLLDNDLRDTLAEATSEILEKGLIDELGALRIVLLKVLLEKHDTPVLITNITRIVTVAAQAMRIQHAVSGEQATTITETVGNLVKSLLDNPPPTTETAAITESEAQS